MLKIYFLLERYYPDITASGNLLIEMINVMSQAEKVEVLCSSSTSTIEIYNEYVVRRFKKMQKDTRIKDIIIGKKIAVNNEMYESLIKEINESNEKIVLIPITISEIQLSIKLKKQFNNIILMPFLLEILPVNYRDSGFIKADIESYSDAIIVLPKLIGYLNHNTILTVEHPMVINNISNQYSSDSINITHIGGLDKRNRNPKRLLKFIKEIQSYNHFSEKKLMFNFYGYGNMDNYLKKMSAKLPNFNFWGSVDSKKSKDILSKSDFLVTIGNKNSMLVPSKLFDYISTGNPIIHFYQNDNDPYIYYLRKYTRSLCVDYDNFSVETIIDFIEEYYNSRANFDEILSKYREFTPEYVSQQILAQVSKL